MGSEKNNIFANHKQFEIMEKALVNDRLNNRFIQNHSKPIIMNNDILPIENYIFKKAPIKRIGDSGKLLLAINTHNKSEKYIVKHEFIDCACNEFMYSKLGQLLGLKFADVKFFNTLTPPLNPLFTTEDVIGIEYLDLENDNVSFDEIKNKCKNFEDYFKYIAIRKLFYDIDSFEIALDKQGYIYKLDNSATFCISNFILQYIYINFDREINGIHINIEKFTKKQFIKQLEYYKSHDYINYENTLSSIKTKYGIEYTKYFLEPFYNLANLDLSSMDNIINTLCYFYPDYIGNYYKQYMEITQNKVKKFLTLPKLT